MNVKIVRVAKAGLLNGKMIVVKMRNNPHPSIVAASSRSRGMFRKYCRSMNVPYAENIAGTANAKYESNPTNRPTSYVRPNRYTTRDASQLTDGATAVSHSAILRIKMKFGIIVTAPGIIIVARYPINSLSRPGNLNLANEI